MNAMQYQAQGEASDLTTANRQLNDAKRATPKQLHKLFKSAIRYHREVHGYCWSWALI